MCGVYLVLVSFYLFKVLSKLWRPEISSGSVHFNSEFSCQYGGVNKKTSRDAWSSVEEDPQSLFPYANLARLNAATTQVIWDMDCLILRTKEDKDLSVSSAARCWHLKAGSLKTEAAFGNKTPKMNLLSTSEDDYCYWNVLIVMSALWLILEEVTE